MAETVDLSVPFAEVLSSLNLKDQRKALRGAMRREGNRLKKVAASNLAATGIGQGTRQPLSKGLQVRVYPERYGAGFMVSAKPHRKKGYHVNRQGLEKPILMWAETGAGRPRRKTRSQSKFYVRKRKGHDTGRMKRYPFIDRTEEGQTSTVENNLWQNFQGNLDKALRKNRVV